MVRDRLDHIWRVIGTGLGFLLFSAGALVLAVTAFPLLRLISANAEITRCRVQRALHRAVGVFIGTMCGLGVVSYEVAELERLRRPGQLIVANHPSLLDVVFLLSLIPEADCIVKEAIWSHPFLGWPARWAQYIPNRENSQVVDQAVERLLAGRSLIVFPEGTRTAPGRPPQMKRGAAQIALAARCPVLPVTIVCHPSTLHKGCPWYRVPARRPHWRIVAGEPFEVDRVIDASLPVPLAARRLTAVFQSRLTPPAEPLPGWQGAPLRIREQISPKTAV